MAKKTIGKTATYLVGGALAIGLAGFGTTSFTGNIQSIGTAGDKPITAPSYLSALQSQMRAMESQLDITLSFPQMQQYGMDREVLSQLVTRRVLENEAAALGVSAPDARVAVEVRTYGAFQDLSGSFDSATYKDALSRNGLKVADFENGLRDELTRTLLQAAVVTGLAEPDSEAAVLASYLAERRDASWTLLTTPSSPTLDPDEETLSSYYEANLTRYSWPERRRIAYAWLTPETLASQMDITEDSIAQLYQQRLSDYVQPERRLVERLVFSSQDAADAARARIDAGQSSFEDEVAARGLALADIDMGDVSVADLGEAGPEVFAAAPGTIVGPAPSVFGPALFRLNAVLAATEVSVEEVHDELRHELALTRARRAIDDLRESLNDLTAGGAGIDDLAANSQMETGEILWSADISEGIAAYDSFRTAAAAAQPGDFPQITELDDGGLFALSLQEVLPAEPKPFAAVAEAVKADWLAEQTAAALTAEAQTLATAIAGGSSFADFGLEAEVLPGLRRSDFIETAPEGFVDALFSMQPGEVKVLTGQMGAAILRLEAVSVPAADDPATAEERAQMAGRLSASISDDLFAAFSAAVQRRTKVTLDQAAITAIHNSFQ